MGCSAAELQGNGWLSRVHPEDRERVTRGAMSAGFAHRNWSDQYRVLSARGAVRWVRSSARPLHDQDGVFTGYLGTCLDITELREAEEDRRRAAVAQAARVVSDAAAARLQALVTGLSAIVWERDVQSGDYTFITDRVVDILGYSINAWIGRSDFWTLILHPADREEAVAAAAAATAAGQDWEQTYRAVGADGRTVWLHDLVHVVRDDTAAASVLGVSIDVTMQKRQDEAMALLAEFGARQGADQPLAERLL
jgi:PAS domain S-box-containing protein